MKLIQFCKEQNQIVLDGCNKLQEPHKTEALKGYKRSKVGLGVIACGFPLEISAAAFGFSDSTETLQHIAGKSIYVSAVGGAAIALTGIYKMAKAENQSPEQA